MNVVCLLGRLTADPELRKTPNDKSVCSFNVAVEKYSNGEKKADFINCVAWGDTAVNISKYFYKGNMIGLNGSIQTRQYQDKDTGKNRTAFEVLINRFYFAGSNSSGNQTQPTAHSQNTNQFNTADIDGFETVDTDGGDLPF